MKKNDLMDSVILEALNLLKNNQNGLRYAELKSKLNISDSTLTNRLNKLKSYDLVKLEAKDSAVGRNYVVYGLTETGIKLVTKLDIDKILETLEETVD